MRSGTVGRIARRMARPVARQIVRRTGWMLALLLAVCVVLSPTAPQPTARAEDPPSSACPICADQVELACPTCKGKKSALVPCPSCEGEGKIGCSMKLDKKEALGVKSLEAVGYHKGTERSCTSPWCIDGKIVWEDGKSYKCRLCGGRAKLPCAECKDAAKPCAVCKGKKTVTAPCADCAGTGRLYCFRCIDHADPCRLCGGDSKADCPVCKEGVAPEQACDVCDGRGKILCETCEGVGKVACERCGASAKQRSGYDDGTTAESKKCEPCGGRGVLECRACDKSGHRECRSCGGKGVGPGVCRSCAGSRQLPCTLCGEQAFRGEELEANVAMAAGARAIAVGLYERALRDVEPWVELTKERADAARKAVASARPSREIPDLSDDAAVREWIRNMAAETTRSLEAIRASIEAGAAAAAATAAKWRIQESLDAAKAPKPK